MARQRTATRKSKEEAKLVRCMECEHSTLTQRMKNPIIAECAARKSFGKPMRQVARMTHFCEFYNRFTGLIKPIKHIEK